MDPVGEEHPDAAHHAPPSQRGRQPRLVRVVHQHVRAEALGPPVEGPGGAISTSKSGRRLRMERAIASRYMRGETVTSIRTKNAFLPADKDRMKGDTQGSSTF